MKWTWVWSALLLAPVMGGCAASSDGPSLGNVGRNFADDWTGARGYDRAQLALERGDLTRVQEVGHTLNRRIAGGSRSAFAVASAWINARSGEAGALEEEASNTPDSADRDQTRREANRLYRAALAFLPSGGRVRRELDPNTLNSLGYFLAQRGRTPAESQQAVDLTGLAIELAPARDSLERYARAVGPQDSHAWALFKQGEIAKALQVQTQVLSTINENATYRQLSPEGVSEVVYHMGAILRVAGHEEQARAAFRTALGLKPSVELEEILHLNLEGRVV